MESKHTGGFLSVESANKAARKMVTDKFGEARATDFNDEDGYNRSLGARIWRSA